MNENITAMSEGRAPLLATAVSSQALSQIANPISARSKIKDAAFSSTNRSLVEDIAAQVADQTIRIEAEDLALDGYKVESFGKRFDGRVQVSNRRLISLKETSKAAGTAEGMFQGADGFYDVVVGYYDESDGVSRASVTVAGQTDSFKFDQLLGNMWVSNKNAVERTTHKAVSLRAGDSFKIEAIAKGGEFARFDYVDFVRVEAPQDPTPKEPVKGTPPDGTRSPLYTDKEYRDKINFSKDVNGYSFVSNHEQVAYVSDDTASMIHFDLSRNRNPQFTQTYKGKDKPSQPELLLHLPEGIEVLGAVRNLDIDPSNYQPIINGEKFTNSWRVTPPADGDASKFTLTWRADGTKNWSEGQQLKGYYWGRSTDDKVTGEQSFQPLNIEVVDVPETESFETIPVWLSMPADFVADWTENGNESVENPTADSFNRIGVNEVDLWSYLWDGDLLEVAGRKTTSPKLLNDNSLDSARENLDAVGIKSIPWARDVWWRKAAGADPNNRSVNADGEAVGIDGGVPSANPKYSLRLTYNDSDSAEDSAYFKAWIEQGKALIDRGLYLHSFDPEMYRNGDEIGFDEKTLAAFEDYYQTQTTEAYVDPRTFPSDRHPKDRTESEKIWDQFKAYRYTKFFSDYRTAMEAYMDTKGIDRSETPFEMKALTTYHRQWRGLKGFDDYTESPVYQRTLEDPKMLAEVFDYIAPMSYPDIYANGAVRQNGDYDMKLTRTDTYYMDRLVKDSSLNTEVTPILSAGYTFLNNFDADISAEMLRENILEAIVAGAHGFGIWGETRIDAKDMKVISEAVSMLRPYEDILLSGRPTDGVSIDEESAFVHRLIGSEGSLVLVSDYSDETKPVTVNVNISDANVVVDLDNPGVELQQITNSDNFVKFKTELSNEGGRVKVFYVGPQRA